jgi:uncharacterized membrane protein
MIGTRPPASSPDEHSFSTPPTDDRPDELMTSTAIRRPRRGSRLLGLAFVAAGLNHFLIPRPYRQIVPPWTSRWAGADTIVAVSGVAEVAGGLGVLAPFTRRVSGLWLIALLAAVFPANLHMALNPEEFRRIPRWALYARLPLQPLAMWWAWRATRPQPSAE